MAFLLGCENVHLEYPTKTIFSSLSLGIDDGAAIGVVGKNGDGKSSLLRLFDGTIEPDEGRVLRTRGMRVATLAQKDALDDNATVLASILGDAPEYVWASDARVREILDNLVGDLDPNARIGALSGGQRRRVDLARVLIADVDIVLLDEPTNHLDIQSKDVLKEAIKAFDGTAIIVSHDREFLDGLVDKVYEFGGGKVREHLGGIYDYLRAHNAENINQALANQSMASAGSPSANTSGSSVASGSTADSLASATSGKQSYAEHKEQQKKIRKAEKAVKECEAKIEKLEARKKEIDELLMKPENATNMELVTEYTELMKSLDEENERWMLLSEELEEVSK